MITIILEDSNSIRLASTHREGNQAYLIRPELEYHVLSQLSEVDYDVFCSDDMGVLTDELKRVSMVCSNDERKHIFEILELASRCESQRGSTLTFTPFE